MVKSWSVTQAVIALSSGEAEYYGAVKAASIGMGIVGILADLGIPRSKISIRVKTDSSAAKGIANRKGLGKVRHIEINQLWLQDKCRSGAIEIVKVDGVDNLADCLTKYVDSEGIAKHIYGVGMGIIVGLRHHLMPLTDHNK